MSSTESMKTGQIVRATVTRVEPHGVSFRHGGHDILVLVPELGWQPTDPLETFSPGDPVDLRVLRQVPGEDRYIGSVRRAAMADSPYLRVAQAPPGTRFPARVMGPCGSGPITLELTEPRMLGQLCPGPRTGDLSPGESLEVSLVSVDVEACKAVFEIAADSESRDTEPRDP